MFEVCPMHRYLAQMQYRKAQEKGVATVSDVVYHKQLQVS